MECLETQQVCRCARCGVTAFSLPENCSCIVVYVMNCSFLHLRFHCQDIVVSHQACQFQVAVIDSAVRIGKGNQLTLNPWREIPSPKKWGDGDVRRRNEMYTPHSGSYCITCSNGSRKGIKNQLSNPCRSRRNICGQPTKFLEETVQRFCEI